MGRAPPRPQDIPGVKHIVAVASGKGGVGKSTSAVNLAVALAAAPLSLRVGLLDADVHGPSIPTMMKLSGQPELDDDGNMIPQENYRVRCMSMGFLMKPGQAAAWRGLMVTSALEKMMFGTKWGGLDVLVVDMPPGTGDAQISVSQRLKLSGAVIVSTPQEIALIDARRGVDLFHQARVKVLGLIENMSFFECGNCGSQAHVFGHGGARAAAEEMGVPFLGEVPLRVAVREAMDAGKPVALDTGSAAGSEFASIAQRTWGILQAIHRG
ncbi:unnamed protein product [Pedinophyceae sp. YPF-701]|nr:unnamed protein product [Pedinophyceae sp. YPF-701]